MPNNQTIEGARVTMFGGGDPDQVLRQLESYHAEGRHELAEVMSTQLTDKLLTTKPRDHSQQNILVRGLKILAGILHSRGKKKRAISTVKVLIKERKRIFKETPKPNSNNILAEDFRLAALIYATAKKTSAAKKAYAKCERLAPGHLAASLEAVENIGNKSSLVKRLEANAKKAGPVIRQGENYELQPLDRPSADASRVAKALNGSEAKRILDEIKAIANGEKAANARLAAAMDTLTPTMDYHTYSGG